jgi:hypothetical protein
LQDLFATFVPGHPPVAFVVAIEKLSVQIYLQSAVSKCLLTL